MASAMNKSVSDAPNKKEETYQLLEQLDHILKRPETYIGSNRPCREVKSSSLSVPLNVILSRKCGLSMIRVSKVQKLSKKKSRMFRVYTKSLMKFSVRNSVVSTEMELFIEYF